MLANFNQLNQNAQALRTLETTKINADGIASQAALQNGYSNANTFMGGLLGSNQETWAPDDFVTAANGLNSKYAQAASKIDSLVQSSTNPDGIYTQAEANTLKTQLKDSTNTAIDSVCNNIGLPPVGQYPGTGSWFSSPISSVWRSGQALYDDYKAGKLTTTINGCKAKRVN